MAYRRRRPEAPAPGRRGPARALAQEDRRHGVRRARPVADPRSRRAVQLTEPPPTLIGLHRMTFGLRPGLVDYVNSLGGLDAYIEEQLDPDTIDDSAAEGMIAAANLQTLDMTVPELWALREDPNVPWGLPFDEGRHATWIRAIYSERQLFEVLVHSWHDHFSVDGGMGPINYVWPDYDRRIRRNVFGNFRTFLEDIATSTAMLYYLDNRSSSDAGPNENYARELFELHGLGVQAYTPGTEAPTEPYEGYRDWDVYEAARAFTGWALRDRSWEPDIGDTGEFVYRDDWHDRFGKYVLGAWIDPEQGPMVDGRIVLDRIHAHPATAFNVSYRLARRLVSDTPSDGLVQAGADAFQANLDAPDQLRSVVRALLTHPDFTAGWGEKIRRPFEATVMALRATRATFTYSDSFRWRYERQGQPIFEWPAPNGYPDERGGWTGSATLIQRWTFMNYLCQNFITDVTTDLVGATPPDRTTPRGIMAYWIDQILGYPLDTSETEPLLDFIASGRNPDLPLPADEVDERLPGLVALVLSTPSAMLR